MKSHDGIYVNNSIILDGGATMLPKVTFIILNWNGKEDTIECLKSLKHITYSNYEVLVVDNGSVDGSIETIRENHPSIEIIENGENLGFAEGNNIAINYVIQRGTDYILLLNNDTIVDPDFLTKLVCVAESNPKAGILGPIIYNYNSQIIQSCGGDINLYKGIITRQQQNSKHSSYCGDFTHTGFLTGCAMLIRPKLFKDIGSFDASYFAYYEDVDLCLKAINAGYDLLCVNSSVIWHKGSQSSKINRYGLYYGTRNMIWFEKKYANTIQFLVFLIYFTFVRFPFLIAIALLYHKSRISLKRIIDGTIDGFCSTS